MMADPTEPLPQVTHLTLPIKPTTDRELTCLLCHDSPPCEWEVDVLGFGWRAAMGLHERCRVRQASNTGCLENRTGIDAIGATSKPSTR